MTHRLSLAQFFHTFGEGQGGGDNEWGIRAFHFYSPLTPPLFRKGEEVFGRRLIHEGKTCFFTAYGFLKL